MCNSGKFVQWHMFILLKDVMTYLNVFEECLFVFLQSWGYSFPFIMCIFSQLFFIYLVNTIYIKSINYRIFLHFMRISRDCISYIHHFFFAMIINSTYIQVLNFVPLDARFVYNRRISDTIPNKS